jgi:hypothetical protein
VCGQPMMFSALDVSFRAALPAAAPLLEGPVGEQSHAWHGAVLSMHVEARNGAGTARHVRVERSGGALAPEVVRIAPGGSHRFVVSRSSIDEQGVRVLSEAGLETRLFPLLDRAHFPVPEPPPSN